MRLHRRSANYREIYPRVWTRGSLVLGNGGLLGGYDKISSIRVFDSTTEDEESISRYDFNQDEMGIYFPD